MAEVRRNEVIASTQRDDNNPAVAPDGRIAWVSDRSGSREVLAREGRRVGSDAGDTLEQDRRWITLQWSFDGRYLAFDSRPNGYSDIFLLECPAGIVFIAANHALWV